MSQTPYTQLFRGPTSICPYPSWNFEQIFRLQNIVGEPETSEVTVPDPTRPGLPELDGVTSFKAVNLTGEAVDFSPAAAAICLYGSIERTPFGTKTGEDCVAYIGKTIRLAKIPLSITKVTNADGDTEYAKNKDYAVTPGGIKVLVGGDLAADIAATTAATGVEKSLPIKVDYAFPTVDLIKPFTAGRKYYRVMCEQINEGGGNERRRVTGFYARISLNGGMPLLSGDEFATIPVQIHLLPDPEIIEPGEASMWTIEHQVIDA
ncbi:hypothetical protein PKB_1284 [Pseudomonas knackmussii B13]|uniref:Uncharacterized protein n=1 Tax=Pseudomonas knackmussii (strain DSM 6978 / CCUG 54928 / LMG 23759 / B13) TaxID=1301098 RepID=A0A024HDI7_PSEKB|nr:hypothetical protein [Pseudomonas knackmussii]CDF82649.1 hypothetical protein PKB_1284 [Pseudomonas knackmussii B13]